MNNILSDLRAKFEDAQNKRIEAENVWNHIQNTATEVTQLIGTIRLYSKILRFGGFRQNAAVE